MVRPLGGIRAHCNAKRSNGGPTLQGSVVWLRERTRARQAELVMSTSNLDLRSKDEDIRYMALKSCIDNNWQLSGAVLHDSALGAAGMAATEEEKVVLAGLQDTSVLIQDLASKTLIQSFCRNRDVQAVHSLFQCLLCDSTLPCTRALKTILSSDICNSGYVSVTLDNLRTYVGNMKLSDHAIQSIHWDVLVSMIAHYTDSDVLDDLFAKDIAPLQPSDTVLQTVAPHLTRKLVSEYPFTLTQLILISASYPYKFSKEKAHALISDCLDEHSEHLLQHANLCHNLFWFWLTPQGVPQQIQDFLIRLKNFSKDEGDLEDATDSDEFDISLSEDEDSAPMYDNTSQLDRSSHSNDIQNGSLDELNTVIAKFESLIGKILSSALVMPLASEAAATTIDPQPRLYSEILTSTPSKNEELLEAWLKDYHNYDLYYTRSIIDQILDSEFTLFEWQWLITISSRLPKDFVIKFLPRCVPFLKPLKRFIQVIQVGNLKQRQDDALNLRLQLWSLVDSLLNFQHPDPDALYLNELQILTLIIPYLQFGLKDVLKEKSFYPILLSILDKLKDHCDPLLITDEALIQSVLQLDQEQFPWIGPTINSIRFKMM